MRKALSLMTVVITLLTTLDVGAQELWGGLRAGMTVDEVQKAYPLAASQDLKPLPSGRPHPNSALVVLTGLTLADVPFEASFYFKAQDGLVQVALSPADKITRKGQAMVIAQRLLVSLRQKYGPELNAELDKRWPKVPDIVESKWTWAQGDTTIMLKTTEMDGGGVLLGQTGVTYSPGAKKDVNKL